MTEQSEKLARDVRTALGMFNDDRLPVVQLVRAITDKAVGLQRAIQALQPGCRCVDESGTITAAGWDALDRANTDGRQYGAAADSDGPGEEDGPWAAGWGHRAKLEAAKDDAAVDRFALAMKSKLAKARRKGRGGWDDPEQCSPDDLIRMLVEHLQKGNAGTFLDIANFAMMLQERNADPRELAGAVVSRERVESQCIPRTPDVPAKATQWVKHWRVPLRVGSPARVDGTGIRGRARLPAEQRRGVRAACDRPGVMAMSRKHGNPPPDHEKPPGPPGPYPDALQEAIEVEDAEQVKQEFDDDSRFDMALELLRTRRRLQQYEAQCIARTDGMPADAIAWEKYRLDNASEDNRGMRCCFIGRLGRLEPGAPDYRPGCSDPCYLHIVDLEQ